MIITLPDAIAFKYQTAAAQARVSLEKYLERALARAADIPLGQRVIVLSGDSLAEVDQLLGIGSTASPEALLAAIRAWAGITIGDIRLTFSPAQLEEVAYRAARQGKTPEAIVQDLVAQLQDGLFHGTVPTR